MQTFSRESVDVFSIAAQVFSNLFLKTCPPFRQNLITCLKCSRASFSLSSYSEKMRLGRGCRREIGIASCYFKKVERIRARKNKKMKQEKNYKTKRNSIRKRAKINNNNIKNSNSKNTSKEDKNNKICYWMERNSKQILQRNKHQMASVYSQEMFH